MPVLANGKLISANLGVAVHDRGPYRGWSLRHCARGSASSFRPSAPRIRPGKGHGGRQEEGGDEPGVALTSHEGRR
jgi:hypothetical protein